MIWQFNLKTMQQTPVQVDVQDICFEKNLYEIKGRDGSFIAQNTIEKTFGKIEDNTNRVIQAVRAKSENENCLNCPTVLSENDKSYLIILITTLLYRDPATIESGIGFLQESNPNMDDREARNFTLLNLLPLGLDTEWDKNTIIKTAVENLTGMAFQIGIADEENIITSDRPVVIWSPKEDEQHNRPTVMPEEGKNEELHTAQEIYEDTEIGDSGYMAVFRGALSMPYAEFVPENEFGITKAG